ncbi:transketolase C-terminal domain-containing protein [Marispirochaeta aestuarii]|uniref:transketolase family protein n=1 Tax=Marispirochaeta aestuarii TaxID=1963862 RepID=UPI0029C6C435|nr:transketolase C-terminal domain-containing protein [Marispirochaeta aestuarii]
MKQKSTRRAVTEGLFDVIEEDRSIVLVSSDSVGVIKAQDFIEKFPSNFIEVGISEQAAMAISAGIASCGMTPVYVSYAVFATQRACEQLRNAVSYPRLNVKVIGANGGMGSGEREGVTHQGLEDLGITRTIPGITVLSPADAGQVRQAVRAITEKIDGPVYLRIGSGRDPEFWDEDTPFEFGKCRTFFDEGEELVIFGHGFVLPCIKLACRELSSRGVRVRGVEVSTIKPLPENEVLDHLKGCKAALVVEDHTTIGGLGSAVCETSSALCPRRIIRIGLDDQFSESGTPEELFEKYGITVHSIVEKAEEALSNTLSIRS